jgi:Na+-translocating ferredoxin:NAD+ oxidoreductase RnfC subunit
MLEQEIAKLNKNIEHLNELLEAMSDVATERANAEANTKSDEPKADPEPEMEQEPEKEEAASDDPKDYTHDDIKSMALAVVRKDRKQKDAIKEKLGEFGAKVATDLNEADTQVMGDWLKALQDEVPF